MDFLKLNDTLTNLSDQLLKTFAITAHKCTPQFRTNSFCKLNFGKYLLICSITIYSALARGQDIEPRRWGNIPLGTQAIGIGYAYSFGNVLFDPLLETENVEVDVQTVAATYVHPFRLGKKLARFDVLVPLSFAKWEGLLSGEPASVERNGFADPRVRFSINLKGPPALGPKELKEYLAEHTKYTTIGVSLAITLPFGQYFEDKLLNLGLNQFVFRPQAGLVHNWGLWSFELTASVLIFTENNDFFNESNKEQKPLFSSQTHLIKFFPSRSWIAIGASYGGGGQSVVNRQPNNDVRGNLLAGFSYGHPIGKKQNLKLAYFHSETLKDIGSNTNTILLGWSFAF